MKNFNFNDDDVQEFIAEANEMLDAGEKSVLALDQGGDFNSQYNAIFRAFHSIKGGAGMLGLEPLQHHMHEVENHLQACKAEGFMNNAQCSYFLQAIDCSRQLLQGVEVKFEVSFPKTGSGQQQNESLKSVNTSLKPDTKKIQTSSSVVDEDKNTTQKKRGSVFIVDDEKDICEILTELIESENFQVRSFLDPVECFEEFKKHKPDVILTDINMPNMTGLELLGKVSQVDQDIPVIIISGYVTKDSVLDALNKGVFSVIEKPFKDTQIIQSTIHAVKKSQTMKLLNTSLNLLMYQYNELDEYLAHLGKEEMRIILRDEMKKLIEAKKILRQTSK